MVKEIELDNNYCLLKLNDNEDTTLYDCATDIKNIKLKNIKEKGIFFLKIDFATLEVKDYKKILKQILHIKLQTDKKKIQKGISKDSKIAIGYVLNYEYNNSKHNDFILAINAIYYHNRYDRYNYIYDTTCEYLDNCFCEKNLCDFKDNKCCEKRETSSTTGCCRHFKNKWLMPFSKLIVCEFLTENYTCGCKCISCKLFTCDNLKQKGIYFKIRDILLLDTFFNPIQKYFLKYKVFTPKEKILKNIMRFGYKE